MSPSGASVRVLNMIPITLFSVYQHGVPSSGFEKDGRFSGRGLTNPRHENLYIIGFFRSLCSTWIEQEDQDKDSGYGKGSMSAMVVLIIKVEE